MEEKENLKTRRPLAKAKGKPISLSELSSSKVPEPQPAESSSDDELEGFLVQNGRDIKAVLKPEFDLRDDGRQTFSLFFGKKKNEPAREGLVLINIVSNELYSFTSHDGKGLTIKVFASGQEELVKRYLSTIDCEVQVKRTRCALDLPPHQTSFVTAADRRTLEGKALLNDAAMATSRLPDVGDTDHAPVSVSRAAVKSKSFGGALPMTGNTRRVYNDILESPDLTTLPKSIANVRTPTTRHRPEAIAKLIKDSMRALLDKKAKPLRTPHLMLLATVTAHVVGGDDNAALALLAQLFPHRDLEGALREVIIMDLASLLLEKDLHGKDVKPFLINKIVGLLAVPFDPSEAAKIAVFYRGIVEAALPDNDKLVLNLEKTAIGLNFGPLLYTDMPYVTLLRLNDLQRAMMPQMADQADVLLDILASSKHCEILQKLGPSALVFTLVNEHNFGSIALLVVDPESDRVVDRQSLFYGFRNPATFHEWLSLRFFIVCALIASVAPPVLLKNRPDDLVGRCSSTCKHLISKEGIMLASIIKETYLMSQGPEAAVWGSNLIWKSFGEKYANNPASSKLRICNLIRLVVLLTLRQAISPEYSTQGCLVLSVFPLMDTNVKVATSSRRKRRYETAEVVHDAEDLQEFGYEFHGVHRDEDDEDDKE